MARDITQLHPDVQKLAEKLVSECAAAGLIIKITDCLRGKSEQDALYAKGRTTSGSIVTNVKYPNSMHNWGIAFDFCRNDGKGAYKDDDGFFSKVGAIGKKLGLEWGGDWKSPVDKPHFQMKGWGSTPSKLKATYGTPDAYMKIWNKNTENSVNSGNTNTSGNSNNSTNNNASSTSSKKVSDTKMPVIKKGSKGKAVRIWQVILGFTGDDLDGSFGPKTDKKTRAWQESHGLAVDGSVGPITWKAGLESV